MSTSELQPSDFSEHVSDVPPDLMRSVARSVPQTDSTAPPGDHVDIVVALTALTRAITEHNRRVMAGESKTTDWSQLADLLAEVTRVCRRQVVPELKDIGDSGGR